MFCSGSTAIAFCCSRLATDRCFSQYAPTAANTVTSSAAVPKRSQNSHRPPVRPNVWLATRSFALCNPLFTCPESLSRFSCCRSAFICVAL